MKINANPVKGTIDYLPREMELRQQTINKILETFKKHGFLQVKTPILENLEWLTGGDSGDNQKLMFKTIKRGEKLDLTKSNLTENDIVEEGLRYDLTVPLARLYAGNRENLVSPFKAIQIDESFRAEKPQKGRNRQFTQCDIDIWGDPSIFAECEIMLAAMSAYREIGINNIILKINDRRALAQIVEYAGFEKENFNSVCISLDKLDKIGANGVVGELVEKFAMLKNIEAKAKKLVDTILKVKNQKPDVLLKFGVDAGIVENLSTIAKVVEKYCGVKVEFDITVVRGQGYYTGTVFECYMADGEFKRAIGGGGRYDKMLEKYFGMSVPAVGYSIGLDPVLMILDNSDKKPVSNKIALIYPKNTPIFAVFDAKMQLLNKKLDVSAFVEPKNYKNFCEKLKLNNFFAIVKIEDLNKVINI